MSSGLSLYKCPIPAYLCIFIFCNILEHFYLFNKECNFSFLQVQFIYNNKINNNKF